MASAHRVLSITQATFLLFIMNNKTKAVDSNYNGGDIQTTSIENIYLRKLGQRSFGYDKGSDELRR